MLASLVRNGCVHSMFANITHGRHDPAGESWRWDIEIPLLDIRALGIWLDKTVTQGVGREPGKTTGRNEPVGSVGEVTLPACENGLALTTNKTN